MAVIVCNVPPLVGSIDKDSEISHTFTETNLVGLFKSPLAGGKGGNATVGGGAGGGPVARRGMLRLLPNGFELSETLNRCPDGDFAPDLGALLKPREEDGRLFDIFETEP